VTSDSRGGAFSLSEAAGDLEDKRRFFRTDATRAPAALFDSNIA
jgi:hypothetical protein